MVFYAQSRRRKKERRKEEGKKRDFCQLYMFSECGCHIVTDNKLKFWFDCLYLSAVDETRDARERVGGW